MDRCALAFNYRKEGYNCAQAVAAAFADLLGTTPDAAGGSHERLRRRRGRLPRGALRRRQRRCLCAQPAASPDPADRGGHKTVYPKAKEFRRRFEEMFGHTRCGDLRTAAPGATEATPAASGWGPTATATSWWSRQWRFWNRCWRRTGRRADERRSAGAGWSQISRNTILFSQPQLQEQECGHVLCPLYMSIRSTACWTAPAASGTCPVS